MVGAGILEALRQPMTVSVLWDRLRARCRAGPGTPVSYATFVLGLDLLYILGAVDLRGGEVCRTGPRSITADGGGM